MAIQPGDMLGRYRLLERIGMGGMGEVYLAEDTELNRHVAIKFLATGFGDDAEGLERFRREARAAAALDHPQIVTIHEVGDHAGRPYIVMAHVAGATLAEKIVAGPFRIEEILRYALQLAEGVGKAHQAGIVHRDLKPDNVLVDADDHVRILDFGLAKLQDTAQLTREAVTLGTAHYMSPEQTQTSNVDARSDLFSLGTILFQMITGNLPFTGDSPTAVGQAIQTQEPPPLARFNREATPGLQHIVEKALAKDPGERYQTAADLAADLRREQRLLLTQSSMPTVTRPSSRRRGVKLLVPASILGLLVVAFLIFKPFRLEFASDQPVQAAENTLAVMYFENKTDPADEARLGEILTDLLITDLSESPQLKVLSSQRLYDLVKLEGREGAKTLDRTVSTDVARRAHAKWMLMGSLLQVEPRLIATAQLVDVASGAVASAQRASGDEGGDIFALAERLAADIRADLALPTAGDGSAPDGAGIQVSTHSTEAYRHYLEGREHRFRYDLDRAREAFLSAVELDSTFAMAYFQLARVDRPHAEEHIARAMAHAEKASAHERLWIEAEHASIAGDQQRELELMEEIAHRFPEDKEVLYELGRLYQGGRELDQALEVLQRAIELDPGFKVAYNQLAYVYHARGEMEQSITAINRYIELAPDEPNPYDTRGELYALNGDIDAAIRSFRQALEVRPGFWMSVRNLGHMYRAKRDYAAAEATYRQMLDSDSSTLRSQARVLLANLLTYQGRFEDALRQYEQGIAADQLDNQTGTWDHFDKWYLIADIHLMMGNPDRAREAFETLVSLVAVNRGPGEADEVQCEWWARSGDIDSARRIEAELKSRPDLEAGYLFCAGWVGLESGAYDVAIDRFARYAGGPGQGFIWSRLPLARAYLGAGRLSEAVTELESLLDRYDSSWGSDPVRAASMHYYAGRAYEESGWTDRAIDQYETLLLIWENADPGIPMREEAARRLDALHASS